MTRALYFLGGLVAMAMIQFALTIDLLSLPHAAPAAGVVAEAVAPDASAKAIDDLAAWPQAASR